VIHEDCVSRYSYCVREKRNPGYAVARLVSRYSVSLQEFPPLEPRTFLHTGTTAEPLAIHQGVCNHKAIAVRTCRLCDRHRNGSTKQTHRLDRPLNYSRICIFHMALL
jgi:hypothetical protein